MADRKEVVTWLKICGMGDCSECCPYRNGEVRASTCYEQLMTDALSLLKAQQERIKELEELLHEGGCDGLNACSVKSCPYYNASHVRMEETRAAFILELQVENEKLKDQINDLQTAKTPKVMTLEEVLEWAETPAEKRDPIFFEQKEGKGPNGWICNSVCPKDYYLCCLDKDARCWTARPTDEQRKEAKWDE